MDIDKSLALRMYINVAIDTFQASPKQYNGGVALCRTIRTQLTCRSSILSNNVFPPWCCFLQQLARILAANVMSTTIIGNIIAGVVIGQTTCLQLGMAIMLSRQRNILDETFTSLTQKRDWFKSGQIISARRSTHKTA